MGRGWQHHHPASCCCSVLLLLLVPLLVSGRGAGLDPAAAPLTSGFRGPSNSGTGPLTKQRIYEAAPARGGASNGGNRQHTSVALPGFCLTANQACVLSPKRRNLIGEFNETYNTIGCAERCEQVSECQYWTWWGEDDRCQIFKECNPSTINCRDCQTGPRSCGLWETTVAAISGGLANADPPNRSEITLADYQTCNSTLEMPRSRWGHVSLAIGNNYIVCGGTTDLGGYIAPNETCDIYNILSRRWSVGASMKFGRHAAAALDVFGQMFVIGGIGSGGELLNNLEVYEPDSRSWRSQQNLTLGLAGHCAVGIRDLIVLTGGITEGERVVSGVLLYNTTSKVWARLPSMLQNRAHHGCSAYIKHNPRTVVMPEIIVTGGVMTNMEPTATVEIFSFSTRSWTSMTSLPRPLAFHSQINVEGTIRVYGGELDGEPTDQVLQLTPSNSWTVSSIKLNKAVKSASATTFAGDLLNC